MFLLTAACSAQLEDEPTITVAQSKTVNPHQVSIKQAIAIADSTLNTNQTRSAVLNRPSISYILNNRLTRSSVLSDTLAYILNYPDEGGFAIIAADNRVNPVLAYSEQGNFNGESDIANKYFIDHIAPYMEKAATATPTSAPPPDGSLTEYVKAPSNYIKLHQFNPWNKYIVQEYPGFPVGCVALTTATLMLNSDKTLDYHGTTYIMSAIRRGLTMVITVPSNNSQTISSSTEPEITPLWNIDNPWIGGIGLTYAQAQDRMAGLIYWVAKDLDIKYTTQSIPNNDGTVSEYKVGLGNAAKAHKFLTNLEYDVTPRYTFRHSEDNDNTYERFNQLINYLMSGYVISISGKDLKHSTDDDYVGHNWVITGCKFSTSPSLPDHYVNRYVYCDWQEIDVNNGYFSCEVIESDFAPYQVTDFFGAK